MSGQSLEPQTPPQDLEVLERFKGVFNVCDYLGMCLEFFGAIEETCFPRCWNIAGVLYSITRRRIGWVLRVVPVTNPNGWDTVGLLLGGPGGWSCARMFDTFKLWF